MCSIGKSSSSNFDSKTGSPKNVFYYSIQILALLLNTSHSEEASSIQWLGQNLAPNPGFEKTNTKNHKAVPGWKLVIQGGKPEMAFDKEIRMAGKLSLRLDLLNSPESARLQSEPIPVQPGKRYLFSIAFRQEGFNRKERGRDFHEGVSSYPLIEWLNGKQRQVGRNQSASRFPYASTPWNIRDAILQVPEDVAFARIVFGFSNGTFKHIGETIPSRLWLDAVQFREYLPPSTPDWALGETPRSVEGGPQQTAVRAFFVAGERQFSSKGGQWSKIVIDKEAERGSALQAPANTGRGIMAHSPYFPAMSLGLYRMRARVKLADNRTKTRAGYIDILGRFVGMRLLMEFHPPLFNGPNQYQVIEQDFIVRDSHWWTIRLYTDGNQAWSVDSVKIFPLDELKDRQMLEIYPGIAGQVPPKLRPKMSRPFKMLFVAGLGYDAYRPTHIIRLLDTRSEAKPIWVRRDRSVNLIGFPETAEQLFEQSCVLLCNLNAKGLTLHQKNMLREFVKRGGAMVIFGGHQAYERGNWVGSLLEETLPIRIGDSLEDGLLHEPKGLPLKIAGKLPWPREAEFDAAPRIYFLHQVSLKANAQVFATAGSRPFLVGGEYGKGRVVCVLGVGLGSPRKGQTPFWIWTDWIYFMRNACWWAMRYDGLNLR